MIKLQERIGISLNYFKFLFIVYINNQIHRHLIIITAYQHPTALPCFKISFRCFKLLGIAAIIITVGDTNLFYSPLLSYFPTQ